MFDLTESVLCARCGEPALGYATIDGKRYCHDDERSCYTLALRTTVRATSRVYLDGTRIHASTSKKPVPSDDELRHVALCLQERVDAAEAERDELRKIVDEVRAACGLGRLARIIDAPQAVTE